MRYGFLCAFIFRFAFSNYDVWMSVGLSAKVPRDLEVFSLVIWKCEVSLSVTIILGGGHPSHGGAS